MNLNWEKVVARYGEIKKKKSADDHVSENPCTAVFHLHLLMKAVAKDLSEYLNKFDLKIDSLGVHVVEVKNENATFDQIKSAIEKERLALGDQMDKAIVATCTSRRFAKLFINWHEFSRFALNYIEFIDPVLVESSEQAPAESALALTDTIQTAASSETGIIGQLRESIRTINRKGQLEKDGWWSLPAFCDILGGTPWKRIAGKLKVNTSDLPQIHRTNITIDEKIAQIVGHINNDPTKSLYLLEVDSRAEVSVYEDFRRQNQLSYPPRLLVYYKDPAWRADGGHATAITNFRNMLLVTFYVQTAAAKALQNAAISLLADVFERDESALRDIAAHVKPVFSIQSSARHLSNAYNAVYLTRFLENPSMIKVGCTSNLVQRFGAEYRDRFDLPHYTLFYSDRETMLRAERAFHEFKNRNGWKFKSQTRDTEIVNIPRMVGDKDLNEADASKYIIASIAKVYRPVFITVNTLSTEVKILNDAGIDTILNEFNDTVSATEVLSSKKRKSSDEPEESEEMKKYRLDKETEVKMAETEKQKEIELKQKEIELKRIEMEFELIKSWPVQKQIKFLSQMK